MPAALGDRRTRREGSGGPRWLKDYRRELGRHGSAVAAGWDAMYDLEQVLDTLTARDLMETNGLDLVSVVARAETWICGGHFV